MNIWFESIYTVVDDLDFLETWEIYNICFRAGQLRSTKCRVVFEAVAFNQILVYLFLLLFLNGHNIADGLVMIVICEWGAYCI